MATVVALAACTDDDDGGGISLSQSSATQTPTGTVPVGTIPIPAGFAEDFAELRAEIEAELNPSPLSDEADLDRLVATCDGRDADPESQFQGCLDLLELLVAQDSPDIQPLVDLTTQYTSSQFPDRQDEINQAAGLSASPEPTTTPAGAGTVPVDPNSDGTAGTVPIG
jgi:hypothetical protein